MPMSQKMFPTKNYAVRKHQWLLPPSCRIQASNHTKNEIAIIRHWQMFTYRPAPLIPAEYYILFLILDIRLEIYRQLEELKEYTTESWHLILETGMSFSNWRLVFSMWQDITYLMIFLLRVSSIQVKSIHYALSLILLMTQISVATGASLSSAYYCIVCS